MMGKKIGDLTVNDGKGLLDNDGVCDSLLLDLNKLPKLLIDGQFIQFCTIVSGMAQRIVNLKSGIKNDLDAVKQQLDEANKHCDELANEIFIITKKDGGENGGN